MSSERADVEWSSSAIGAGAAAGLAGLAVFLLIHHLWITPIWAIAPVGALIAAVAGAVVGAAYATWLPRLPRRPWRAGSVVVIVALTLAPAFLLAQRRGPVFQLRGEDAILVVPPSEAIVAFAELLLTAGLVGLAIGWIVGRTARAALLTSAAGLLLAIGPGHNIPFLGGTPSVAKELVLIGSVVVTASIVLVELEAWLARRSRAS